MGAFSFRDGDYLTELGVTLTDLAEYARLTGDLGTAERYAAEAITVAAPRGLIPAQSSGLAARARICADLAAATHGPDHVARGRDAADAAPALNQLLCFATFVGRWKEIKPQHAINLKRRLDETMYANRVLFSDELLAAYHEFMLALFAMYASTDADAPLRAPIDSEWGNRRNMSWWQDSMTSLFVTASADGTASTASIKQIQGAHDRLAECFRTDLYVTRETRSILAAAR